MELFDSHCHIDVAEFDADRAEVIAKARQAGVTRMLVPAVDAAGIPALLALCQRETGFYPALGLHPIYLNKHQPADTDYIAQTVNDSAPVAVGEIGLDYFVDDLDRDKQQALFEAQLHIAQRAKLPVILHIRKSHDQVLATLRKIRVCGGIAHAFNGSMQQATQFIDLGFKLGFGGTLTYERSSRIRALARDLPLDALVLETDAPDMAVASHRGERNSPEYLPECLSVLARLRDASPEAIATATTRNACEVLRVA